MITSSRQVCADRQMNQADWRNVNLLTVVSKLVLALVMGVVVSIVLFFG